VNTDLRNFRGVFGQPLHQGDAGVEQTINLIRRLVDDGVKDPQVNETAIRILQNAGVNGFDRGAKLQALYAAVAANMLYVEDPVGPFGPKETVRSARRLLDLRAGDCDDFTILLASLAGTIGVPTRAVTIASDPSAPDEFSHIYPEAELAPGLWVSLDAARPGAAYGVAPPLYFRKRVWCLSNPTFRDITGHRPSSLNGYAVLGQPDAVAQDISAVGQSIANVTAAAKGSPWASFATPYTPIAAPAGYGTPGYPGGPPGATLSLAGASPMVLLLGFGALLLFARVVKR
jgi:transglutaminase-like putative cysteine protease